MYQIYCELGLDLLQIHLKTAMALELPIHCQDFHMVDTLARPEDLHIL